jgi:hypothetical protein
VPVRYDTEDRSHINEQIESYNKKLYKVTKSFKHVKLVKVTTMREDFTKHGLHLNNKGKEKMTKELLKNLSALQKRQRTAVICLPWRRESTEAGIVTGRIEKTNEVLNTSIGDERTRTKSALNAQQRDNQEVGKNPTINIKEISRKSKLQRKCPEVKNDDFLWN